METTIIMATIIILLGQMVIKLVLEPVQEAKKTIADIARNLIYFHNVYADPGNRHSAETESEAYTCLRNLASQLIVGRYMVPFYSLVAKLVALPPAKDSMKARTELIALSNNVYSESKIRRQIGIEKMEEIRELLRIRDI